jgi:dTDP-glucose 4,6-dehydratase
MILVTGGAGFIGSNFVLKCVIEKNLRIVNLDKLTYAGNINNLASLEHNPQHIFVQGDIGNRVLVHELLRKYSPRWIVHFAAETHVDRSIHHPEHFLNTNVTASFAFLEEILSYWKQLELNEQKNFHFLNVSTDEVYGSLSRTDPPFTEKSHFAPNSPYAASKASFDHFVRAFNQTYGLPSISTYCSNNFGPYQFPEKLIPLIILHALQGKPLPIYGDGQQIRQWLYVADHCEALHQILERGVPGSSYNIGSGMECTNLSLVQTICRLLDELKPEASCRPHESLIKHVKDRPGHDLRYSLNSSKLTQELGWKTKEPFEIQLRNTVLWYLDHLSWLENVISGEYRDWILTHYEIK